VTISGVTGPMGTRQHFAPSVSGVFVMHRSTLSLLIVLAACTTDGSVEEPSAGLAPWFADLDAQQVLDVQPIMDAHVAQLREIDPEDPDGPAQAARIEAEVADAMADVLDADQLESFLATRPGSQRDDVADLDADQLERLRTVLDEFTRQIEAVDMFLPGAADHVTDLRADLRARLVDELGSVVADDILPPDRQRFAETLITTRPPEVVEPPFEDFGIVIDKMEEPDGQVWEGGNSPPPPWAYAGSSWGTTQLTWCSDSSTPDLSDSDLFLAFSEAAEQWSGNSGMMITHDCSSPDIYLGFRYGFHWDGCTFPWDWSVLANGYYPSTGVIHFDDHKLWDMTTTTSDGGYDLQAVATHEFGHALGLGHSTVGGATMAPNYHSGMRSIESDDISGIQWLYGSPPDFCAVGSSNASTAYTFIDTAEYFSILDLAYSGNSFAVASRSYHNDAGNNADLAKAFAQWADLYSTSWASGGAYYSDLAQTYAGLGMQMSYLSYHYHGSYYGLNAYSQDAIGIAYAGVAENYENYCFQGY
jgi:hypothetical protein